jgi:hypothetical protein
MMTPTVSRPTTGQRMDRAAAPATAIAELATGTV